LRIARGTTLGPEPFRDCVPSGLRLSPGASLFRQAPRYARKEGPMSRKPEVCYRLGKRPGKPVHVMMGAAALAIPLDDGVG
jgi:hypothetical protein